MSVDFHIPKRDEIPIAKLVARLRELVEEFLHTRNLAIAVSLYKSDDVGADTAAVAGTRTAGYMITLHETRALLTFLGLDVLRDREVYLVTPDRTTPLGVVWGVLVASAVCELGGTDIDDEGYLSTSPHPLFASAFLQLLRETPLGRNELANARQMIHVPDDLET